MNKLQELINELCPNGVEYKTIGDISKTLKKETLKTNELIEDGKYPVINSGREIYGFYNDYNNEGNAVTIAARGEYAGVINYFSDKFWAGGLCYPYTSINENILNTKFLYYYLKSKEKNIMETLVTRGSIPALNKNDLDKYKIAVPPLKVQREIVCILDKFVNYNELLDSEFKKRKKQLEFVMQEELKVKNFNKFCTIGELCKIEKGKTPLQKAVSGKYPLVATTEYLQSSDKYQFDCEAVCMPLISSRGHGVASITRIFYQQGKFALGNILCAIIPKNNKIKAEFLRHYLYYNKDFLLVPLMTGGANVSLTIDSLKNVKVPVTSLENQNRIIKKINTLYKILDKKNGLPAEIELRQKQYEYYRDKLLTFKELKIC